MAIAPSGPFKAFKGFDENLKCRDQQFEVGQTYEITFPVDGNDKDRYNPKLCSNQGFHYCNTLEDVFDWYSPKEQYKWGDAGMSKKVFNRYCEIEVYRQDGFTVGNSYDRNKCIARKIYIVREIPREEIEIVRNDKMFNLHIVRAIQKRFPEVILGGSTALMIQGITWNRIKQTEGGHDFDLITPYYNLFESLKEDNISAVPYVSKKGSGNDFDYTMMFDGIKADIRIDNKHKYDLVTRNGHTYKVAPIEDIIMAKCRYSLAGGESGMKHYDDLREMLINNEKTNNNK